MPTTHAPPSPETTTDTTAQATASQAKTLRGSHPLLHYAAYFIGVGSIVFVAQTGEAEQIETAVLAGTLSAASVMSYDWYNARLDPSMASDPTALITLFNEMLHAGRAQVNTNAAHLKRVEFLQVDLAEAMRDFNNLLRLPPEEIEQRLRTVQNAHLTSALQVMNTPTQAPTYESSTAPSLAGETHRPDNTTVRQSFRQHRPGFDA